MNRLTRESSSGGRSGAVGPSSSLLLLQQRRARAAASASSRGSFMDTSIDDNLDLFSKTRRSVTVAAAPDPPTKRDGPDGFNNDSPKLPSISVASIQLPKTGTDDLLLAADMGKHDYDWLLTPPGTPLSGSADPIEHQSSPVLPKSCAPMRSLSTSKASRFSTSHLEGSQIARSTPSNSATRPSISSSYSAHFSNTSTKNSVLNTSTMSVTSIRSSTPTRSSTPSRSSTTTTRPATPNRVTPTSATTKPTASVTRPGLTRPATPVKVHPTPNASADKTRSLHASRPSTPTSRPQISSTASSPSSSSSSVAARHRPSLVVNSISTPPISRSNSRPSTPTCLVTAPSTPVISRSSSVGRVPAATRTPGPASRPSSPGPKPRATPMQPILSTDSSLDVAPNLRTKLPERSPSVGRTRSGVSLANRSNMNSEAPASTNSVRRPSSPVVSRGRLPENNPKGRLHNNGVYTTPPDMQKAMVTDGTFKKPAKTAATTESTGFGRTISKKSLDMALRHMDIRQGMGGIRGASLFPQSIKSATSKAHTRVAAEPMIATARRANDSEDDYCNGNLSTNGSINDGISENGDNFASSPRRVMATARTVEVDIYESSRYDSILLKEDSKNMSWLHSVDDKSDQSPAFDHRFEPLPEPFSLT